MKTKARYFIFALIVFVVFVLMLAIGIKKGGDKPVNNIEKQTFSSPTPTPSASAIPFVSPLASVLPVNEKKPIEHNVLLEVPFIVQAPHHNWKDLIYQNACEEAAILMAMRWVEGRPLTNEEAFTEIQKISDFSKAHYGFYLDQSAEDLAVLMRDYFKYPKVAYRNNIQIRDIKAELKSGNLVLVPVNGQKLGNPYFTQPGPTEHMLVIKGYDVKSKEFITNDAGVGKGNGYRYKEQILDNALQRYPSGYHEKITKIEKVMIVVEKSNT